MVTASTPELVLDAARRVVGTRGPGRLTLSAVALEAGVSRPTLYRWFPTKAILLAAMTADAVDRFDAGLRATIDAQRTPKCRLGAALRYIVRYLDDVVGSSSIGADADFALQSLADSLNPHVDLLADLLGDALDQVPAVAAGSVTRTDAAEILLRVAYSHYLVPHADAAVLLDVLTAFAGIVSDRSPGPANV